MTFSRERGRENEAGAIQTYLFGGLNTTASQLNCPFEDSPNLLNCDVGIEGSVEKRKGTRVAYEVNTHQPGVGLIPFTTALNYNLLLTKRGLDLEVYEYVNEVATRVITKSNVFNSLALNIAPNFVRTSEPEPRLILLTGYNKPVQVSFVEQQTSANYVGGTTVTFTNASRYKNATAANCLVFNNRVRVATPAFSYNAGTQTLTVTVPAMNGTVVTDLVLITWQWWAEAMFWTGNKYFKSVTRNNAIPTDQVVAIPREVRTDQDPLEGNAVGYQTLLYRRSQANAGSVYTFAGRQPSTFEQYGFSDGARYVYAVDNFLTPSPFFVSFGALEAGGLPSTVYFLRRRELRLNYNNPLPSGAVHVYVNGVYRNQVVTNIGSVYLDYWLHERIPDGTGGWISTPITNTATQNAYYLSFEAQFLGLPGAAEVEVIHNVPSHIGSAATNSRYDYNDGSYFPIYGIGLYADYKSGYYPSTCTITQGRLVLGGFPHQPLLLVFSATYDAVTPGNPYSFFQVTDDLEGLDTDPFDINISSRPDDRIIAVMEWQSSLFCLTRRAAFRLHGGNQPLSIRNRFVNFISNQGCVNSRCIARTEDSILYLADTGVYDLVPQIENAEYQTREKSIKIRNIFGVTTDPAYEPLPWLEYDSTNKRVFLGYPKKGISVCNKRLYTYSTVREAWTKYDTVGGFNTFAGAEVVDRLLGTRFMLACSNYSNSSVPDDFILLKMDDESYLDFRRVGVASGVQQDFLIPQVGNFFAVTTANRRLYNISTDEDTDYSGFPVLPISQVEDVLVTLSGVRQTFGVDFVKTNGGDILFLKTPAAGKSLFIRPRRPVTDTEAGQVLHGVASPQDITPEVVLFDHVITKSYTIFDTGLKQYARLTTTAGTVVETGNAYLSIYTSPLLAPTLMNLQRMLHVYMYFDNRLGQDVYRPEDVNTSSGQPQGQIVDVPKNRLNASISVLYSSNSDGETSADIYGFSDIVWDDALVDIDSPTKSFQEFQLFKEAIKGVGYSVQLMLWNFDEATFRLAGYQVDANIKGKRYKSRY